MRPRIGITSAFDSVTNKEMHGSEVGRHAALLRSLGADPVILVRGSGTARALQLNPLHGVIFSGGVDIDSALYGGRDYLANDRVDRTRDAGELSLLRAVFSHRVPTLGVCRGMQLANVAFGGSLIEDIRTELGSSCAVEHRAVRYAGQSIDNCAHLVRIDPSSTLAKLLQRTEMWTNSVHHQAIRTLAPPLKSVARADDGIIEAIELISPDFFFLGVQWHPESSPTHSSSSRMYAAFIDAASTLLKR